MYIWININFPHEGRKKLLSFNSGPPLDEIFYGQTNLHENPDNYYVIVSNKGQNPCARDRDYILQDGDTITIIPTSQLDSLLVLGKIPKDIIEVFGRA